MFDVAEPRSARNGEADIACLGPGARLLVVPLAARNVDVAWENPRRCQMPPAPSSFSRNAHFDRRGAGMSGPSLKVACLDERADDVRAVVQDVVARVAPLLVGPDKLVQLRRQDEARGHGAVVARPPAVGSVS
jgi:hypothetical protein